MIESFYLFDIDFWEVNINYPYEYPQHNSTAFK